MIRGDSPQALPRTAPRAGRPWLALALALAAGTLGALGLRALFLPAHPEPTTPGVLWPNPRALQPFRLTDDRGRPFTRADLQGYWTILAYGYASCPDVCPMTLAELARLRRLLGDRDRAGRPLRYAFLTLDPARDSAERLGAYVRYFDPTFLGLRAADPELLALTTQLGVFFRREPPAADGSYAVQHSATIAIIGPRARLLASLPMPHDAQRIATVFERLASEVD